jgi:hypothetical protein
MNPFHRNERRLRSHARSRKHRVNHDHEQGGCELGEREDALRCGSEVMPQKQKKSQEAEDEQQPVPGLEPSFVP